MEAVIRQSDMAENTSQFTYQAPFELTKKCRQCKESMTLLMLVNDAEGSLVSQRPSGVKVWPHDSSTTAIYLCTNCGAMRATWNQG